MALKALEALVYFSDKIAFAHKFRICPQKYASRIKPFREQLARSISKWSGDQKVIGTYDAVF